ncbi:MAG: transposon-encoded TnpW family protein [Oscillospiraceae bacterium]|nr:transposon-encoded TnpW family protein [Oscillospiraceae bacterium]
MQDHNSVSSGDKPQKNPLEEKTTYRFGNRSFVVESVFKEESPDTLSSVLLRLMKAENEKM